MTQMQTMNILIISLFLQVIYTQANLPCYHYDKILPLPLASHQLAHFHATNKIFIFGGYTGQRYSSSIFRWDTNNESKWFQEIDEKTPTTEFVSDINNVVVINDTIAYFIGVDQGHDSRPIYIFDSLNEKFINNQDLTYPPHSFVSGCLATNNSHIFMVGGIITSGSPPHLNSLQIYDINNNSWYVEQIELSPLNNGFYAQYCKMVDNVLYIFGGLVFNIGAINKYYSYNALTKQWKYL
eukprot:159172_1